MSKKDPNRYADATNHLQDLILIINYFLKTCGKWKQGVNEGLTDPTFV